MVKQPDWKEEADVVIVGYGGAGAAAAVAARNAGATVLVLEKQPGDTPARTNHTPNTRMCGGVWLSHTNLDKAISYLEGMVKIANETLDGERKQMLSTFAHYLESNTEWMESIGVEVGGKESMSGTFATSHGIQGATASKFVLASDFPGLPGSDSIGVYCPKITGKYRHGAALFKYLSEAVLKRNIQVMWETPAKHLIMEEGKVRGVVAINKGKEVKIRARRGVVLTCGGFEFNDFLKEHYLRANPVHFYGNPGNTGDGINMVMEVGAAMWHMNVASWRVVMKFPDHANAFATQRHETASIFVDKRGKRFTNERFNLHVFGYELINYDSHAMCYPKIPCYWIFDEKRRTLGPLASLHGACNPPGGIFGDIHYIWSEDNQKEIDRGWIMKANTIEELASQIQADPDSGRLISPGILTETVKRYNENCHQGRDVDFNKPKEWLQPIDDPPYYAMKLWPGGPNTQGGPKRNTNGQVLRLDNTPLPRLYSAGELGSVWGMFYQGGGNIGECIAFGRISGANAAAEKIWK